LRVPPFDVPTAIEGSKLDLGFASWVLSSRFQALIWGFAIEFMSRGFWGATWIRGTCVDLFWESSEFKQKMELILESTQTQIGTLRGRTNALPSAPGESAFQYFWLNISFIGKDITKVEPIARKYDLSAQYMVVTTNSTNYHQ
jgi:hypothetical protein